MNLPLEKDEFTQTLNEFKQECSLEKDTLNSPLKEVEYIFLNDFLSPSVGWFVLTNLKKITTNLDRLNYCNSS